MIKPYLDIYSRLLLIIGGIIISTNYILNISVPNNTIIKIIVWFVLLSTLYNIVNRDFYLPFLGYTAYPQPQKELSGEIINVNIEKLPAETNVIFWASKDSDKTFEDPISAYGKYENSGIGKTDKKGNITIQILKPSAYKVPKFGYKKILHPHIHYRYELKEYPGMFSRVYTQKL